MRLPRFESRQALRFAAIGVSLLCIVPLARAATNLGKREEYRAELVNVPSGSGLPTLPFDSLMGRSGYLRVAFFTRDEVDQMPSMVERWGADARMPGVRTLTLDDDGIDTEFSLVTLKPWREKLGSYVNNYHVGRWPGEQRRMGENYENPIGFIEVTPQNQDLRLSKHFTLRSFVTHDQERVWPKYVVLREELLDKLELVLTTLEATGVKTENVVVLSGFRTPQHNARASGEGAAYASRHQFGDAADLIIDANGDGRMDDLNRDGVVDFMDTDVINRAVERVERQYPDLVGGLGLYRATGPSGPFAHIDVRGTRARWNNLRSRRALAVNSAAGDVGKVKPTGTCKAPPEFEHLCKRKAH